MSEEYYKLNKNGIVARNELLLFLNIKPRSTGKLQGTFNVKEIKEESLKITLDRHKVLTPLLNTCNTSMPVVLNKIEEFFIELLERVAADYRKKSNQQSSNEKLLGQLKYPTVSNQKLQQYLIACINDNDEKDKWDFPKEDLLDEVITPVPPQEQLERQNKQKLLDANRAGNINKLKTDNILEDSFLSNVKIDREIVDLFWNLDYKQERTFEDVLEENAQCISFSVAAPCETTQKWLLNRLMRQIPNIDDALIIPPIDLSKNPMRHTFNLFWENLSITLGTEFIQDSPQTIIKGQNNIIRELCYMDFKYPIILIIHNFQYLQNIQKKIVQDFWERVIREIKGSDRRTESSRLVLFFVDRSSPVYTSSQVINLDPLESISQSDVRAWLYKPVVLNWWQSQFERNFANDLISECFSQNNNSYLPRSILDRICLKFGLENGVVEIEESWKWTL